MDCCAVVNLLQLVNVWYMKHVHHVPESCLRHCIEGLSEAEVDSIDSLSLSVGFMRDKMHFLHVDVDTSALPAFTLSWF